MSKNISNYSNQVKEKGLLCLLHIFDKIPGDFKRDGAFSWVMIPSGTLSAILAMGTPVNFSRGAHLNVATNLHTQV